MLTWTVWVVPGDGGGGGVKNQDLSNDGEFPCFKDTFSAIAMLSLYLNPINQVRRKNLKTHNNGGTSKGHRSQPVAKAGAI